MISRILVISTNRETAPQPTLPIGAAWVAEALHQAGFEVAFLDLCFEKFPLKRLAGVVSTFEPEGIALSVRNIDNCDFLAPKTYLPELKAVTDYLKSCTGARILLGGAGVSVMPLQVLDYLDLDFAVAGEGETAAVRFFQAADPGNEAPIPGLVCRGTPAQTGEAGERLLNPGCIVPHLYNWVDVSRYRRFEPVLPIQGKRGCANRCLYCTYNRIEGAKWRLREPAAVAEEILAAIARTRTREFEFVDSVFNEPEGYVEALLEELVRRQVKARFHLSSVTPRGLTKQQVALMERAGVTSLVITPESASDVTLAALIKDFTAEEVHRAGELLAGSRIKVLWCFLLGGPAEDAATLAETVAFINERTGLKESAFITSGIRIYPHTGLHQLAIEEGMVAREESLLMPAFYFTRRLVPQKMRDILHSGLHDPARCIFLSDTRINSIGMMRRMGTALSLPGPFWRYAGYMNRVMDRSRVIRRSW